MKIDANPTEVKAMSFFHAGDTDEANDLQDAFLHELHKYIGAGGDHCPCAASCKHHGNCLDCISIHRGHQDHLPDCLKRLVNERLSEVLSLTESKIIEKA